MNDFNTLDQVYEENIFKNVTKWGFNKATEPFKTSGVTTPYPPQKRDIKGRLLPITTGDRVRHKASNLYNRVENGLEALINIGKDVMQNNVASDLPQLKAKMYYIVLRQQPPVGTGFKKKLQQEIYDCKRIADLDKLAQSYKVFGQWQNYKQYLSKHPIHP